MTARRSARDLRAVEEPAWPRVEAWVEAAGGRARVLPAPEARRDRALEALQVTGASVLGALAGECAGVLVDHGWLRLLGAGADGLPGLQEANHLDGTPPPWLVVAVDALGGRFAVNGGGLDAPAGEVCFWGPDTLDWRPVGGGHADLVAWALSGATSDFYASLRWEGWEQEVGDLDLDQGLSLWPPPCTAEGRDPGAVSRRAVPLAELRALHEDLARQLAGTPEGSAFRVAFGEEP